MAAARDVAAELRRRLPGLPTKKLHKLLYYCQGHHLAVFDEPLFGETVSAWDMGPVVGQLWYEEKARTIIEPAGVLDESALNTIGYVLSRYGGLTGKDLENLTHSELPWQQAERSRQPGESVRIEPEWMWSYFRTSDSGEDDAELESEAVTEWLRDAPARRATVDAPDERNQILARLASD